MDGGSAPPPGAFARFTIWSIPCSRWWTDSGQEARSPAAAGRGRTGLGLRLGLLVHLQVVPHDPLLVSAQRRLRDLRTFVGIHEVAGVGATAGKGGAGDAQAVGLSVRATGRDPLRVDDRTLFQAGAEGR